MRGAKQVQVSRSITIQIDGEFLESEAERVLEKARAQGLIFEYDTGRGQLMWFSGRPGRPLRALTKQLRALIKK